MRILLPQVLLFAFAIPMMAQNWQTYCGSNERNGTTEITAPSVLGIPFWTVNSAIANSIGTNVYTFGDKLVNSRVTFSPYHAVIECLDLQTGALLWTSPNLGSTSILYATGFNEDAVYAHDYDTDTIYALNVNDGSIKWRSEVTSMSFGPLNGVFYTCNRDLVVNGPGLFNQSTMRLDKHTGDTMWTNANIISIGPNEVQAMHDDTYYTVEGAINTAKRLVAVDTKTGSSKYYSAAIPGDPDQENPITIGLDGTIYLSRDGGNLFAFEDDGASLSQKWVYTPLIQGITGNFGIGPDSNLLVVDGGKIRRLNHITGMVMDSSVLSVPSARFAIGADSTIYINDLSGMYYALTFDLQTIKWSLPVSLNYYSGPTLAKDGIFIVSGAGTNIKAYKQAMNISPVVDFTADTLIIPAGQPVDFFDLSSYSPALWQWNFPGATVTTSALQNPSGILYPVAGVYDVELIAANAFGSDTVLKECFIEVTQPSGLGEYNVLSSEIFPNPANDFVMIPAGVSSLAIYDSAGRVVKNMQIKGRTTVSVNELPDGFYSLKLHSEKFQSIHKLIVQH